MLNALAHRGPDDQGTVVLDGEAATVGLAHRRLSILDLTAAAHQPMCDERTGNHLVFNGEIYNFRGLRPRISDVWRSQSDAEVVLQGYGKWGRDVLEHLRGMFAFALWDAQKGGMLLCRDRLGIKPLYYYSDDGVFLFASELRALLASGRVRPVLDPSGLWNYLSYQTVPAPRTLVERVRMLMPGTWLWVGRDGAIEDGRFWDPLDNSSSEARACSRSESRLRVRELLRESVELHLVSDVPVGAFLSGGIDSSSVVTLMREVGAVPRTFSVVFSENAYSEGRFARQIAKSVGSDHVEIPLRDGELLDQLPGALAAMDQPTGDGINTYVISQAVRSAGIKVVQSGLGGDELFAGYPSFARLRSWVRYLRLWGNAPARVRQGVAGLIERLGGSSVASWKVAAALRADGSLAGLFPPIRQMLSLSQKKALLHPTLLERVQAEADPYTSRLAQAFSRNPGAGLISRISYAETSTYMHDVLLRDTDQMSMCHALEVRVPLLDHRLVEFVMGLPDECKAPRGTPKRLLVESVGSLPQEIVQRPKKGFALPFEVWMRGALRGFCEDKLHRERIESQGIFRPERVSELWQSFLNGGKDVSWSRLWILIALVEWLEKNRVVFSE
jgi:asparagine synthase (glutamine-hydrolysing)